MEQWLRKILPQIGYYLAGFVDGEGSFNLSLRRGEDYRYGWQLGLSFNVSQRDQTNLLLLKKHLGCGGLKTRMDGVHSFVVENSNSLRERVGVSGVGDGPARKNILRAAIVGTGR